MHRRHSPSRRTRPGTCLLASPVRGDAALFRLAVLKKVRGRVIRTVCRGAAAAPEMERTELDALVSFMLVHHPVPALPVVCSRGEGSGYEEAVASSHDILANGIRFQMLHAQNFTMAALQASREAKEALLLQLQHDIAAAAGSSGNVSNAQLAACYALYSAAARAYQALYLGSLDMRTLGMDSVCCSDVVHKQALSHATARASMFEARADAQPLTCGALSPYTKLIRATVEQQRVGPGV